MRKPCQMVAAQSPMLRGSRTVIVVPRRFQWNSRSGLPTWGSGLFYNPKGIGSFSPALARFIEGLRWVATREDSNPERVVYQRLMRKIQLFQSCYFPVIAPRVARSAQPWADRFNPFGIGLNPRRPRTAFGIPLKTAKNQADARRFRAGGLRHYTEVRFISLRPFVAPGGPRRCR